MRYERVAYSRSALSVRPHPGALEAIEIVQRRSQQFSSDALPGRDALCTYRPLHCLQKDRSTFEFFGGLLTASHLPKLADQEPLALMIWSGIEVDQQEVFARSYAEAELAELVLYGSDEASIGSDMFEIFRGLSAEGREEFFGTKRRGAPTFSRLSGLSRYQISKAKRRLLNSIDDVLGTYPE